MIPLFLKLQYKPGNFMQKLKQIDWIGSFLFVASTTSTLIPITWVSISISFRVKRSTDWF